MKNKHQNKMLVLFCRKISDSSLFKEVLPDLSLYITAHVNRFGKYGLDPNRKPPILEFDVPLV